MLSSGRNINRFCHLFVITNITRPNSLPFTQNAYTNDQMLAPIIVNAFPQSTYVRQPMNSHVFDFVVNLPMK